MLVLNSAYLAAYATPSLFYMTNVLFHVVLGLVLILPFMISGIRVLKQSSDALGRHGLGLAWLTYGLMIISMMAGAVLTIIGNTRPHQWILKLHILTAILAIVSMVLCLGIARRMISLSYSTGS